jgi:hypothetical protein
MFPKVDRRAVKMLVEFYSPHFNSAKIAKTMDAKVANVSKTCQPRHFTSIHFPSSRNLIAAMQSAFPSASLLLHWLAGNLILA